MTGTVRNRDRQTSGAVSMLPQDGAQMEIDPDPKLEEEAEKTAQRVMAGGKLDIQRMSETEMHVQRVPDLVAQRGAERKIGFRAEGETVPSEESFATAGPELVQRMEEESVVQRAPEWEQLEAAREEAAEMEVDQGGGGIASVAKQVAEYLGLQGDQFDGQDTAVKATTGAIGAIPFVGPPIQNTTDAIYDQHRQVDQVKSALHDIDAQELPGQWIDHISNRAVKKVENRTGSGIEGKAEGGNV